MKFRLNANAIVTNSKGEFLIIKLKGGPFKDGYSIPGGGINPGEFSLDTIKREVMEETGISLSGEIKPLGFCELTSTELDSHRVVLLMHSTAEGIPSETEEAKAEWKKYEEVKDLLIPFARKSIDMFLSKQNHFTIKD